MQREYLAKIDTLLGAEVLARIPEFERGVTGSDIIARMTETMFGGEEP